MASAKKSSSRKGKKTKTKTKTKAKTAGAKKPSRKGFEEIWMSVGRKLVKEIRAERNWDQKTFLANLNDDPDLPVKLLDSAKRLFPAAAVASFIPETRTSLAPTREERGEPVLNIGSTQYWGSSEPETNESESCDSGSDSCSLVP